MIEGGSVDICELSISAEQAVQIEEGKMTLVFTFKASRSWHPGDITFVSKIAARLSSFRDEAQAREWARQVFTSFRARLAESLVEEAAQTAGDEAHWALDEMQVESVDIDAVIRKHAQYTAKRLRARFGRPPRPAQSAAGNGNGYPVWLTKTQALELSGLPFKWIERAVREQKLKPIGAGRAWRIHRGDLLALVESLRSRTNTPV